MLALALALLLLSAPAAGAATIVIDFEAEPLGFYEPSYAHSCACVTFTGFGAVEIRDFAHQSHGRGIAASDDDSGRGITLTFTAPVTSLSLEFGNDSPSVLDTTDQAIIRAFLGDDPVGAVGVLVNANDVMDQTITLAGFGPFDRAVFSYTGDVDEVIDNVTFETVPEPGTLGLGVLGLAGLLSRRAARPAVPLIIEGDGITRMVEARVF